MKHNSTEKIIRWPELSKMIGLSPSTIYGWEKAGKFPMRIKLGEKAVGWSLHAIEKWMDGRKNLSKKGTK